MQQYKVVFNASAVAAALAIGLCFSPIVLAQEIDTVLDKAEQALGGQALLTDVEAVRIRSHGMWEMPALGIPSTTYEAEVVFRRPDSVRVTWKFPEELGGEFTFGYDGQDAWVVLGAPPARCRSWLREVVLQLAAEPQLFLVAPARAEHPDAFALDTAATENPAVVKVVYRPFGDGQPWNVWFAKDSGELVKFEHHSYWMDGKPILFRSTRSMPKNFGGLKYPSRAKFESVRDGTRVEAGEETIDTVEVNPELSADFFACPVWEIDPATIGTKDVAAEMVVTTEQRGPYREIVKTLDRTMDVIMDAGLVPVGGAFGTYLSDPNVTAPEDLRTEIGVRVAKLKEGEPRLPSGYVFATRPAMRVAYAYHRGDHWTEDEAHERLQAWMAQQGLQPAGPPRGIWFHDPEVTITEDLMTEVQIPVKQ